MEAVNYRKEWFNWVAKERKKMQRKNKAATHRQAMAQASITWPKQKIRLQKKAKREANKKWGGADGFSDLCVYLCCSNFFLRKYFSNRIFSA